MKRGHWHPARCKVCGNPNPGGSPVSQTGLCEAHSRERLLSNIDQMRARSGPNFWKWRRAMAASVGGVLLDDLRETA